MVTKFIKSVSFLLFIPLILVLNSCTRNPEPNKKTEEANNSQQKSTLQDLENSSPGTENPPPAPEISHPRNITIISSKDSLRIVAKGEYDFTNNIDNDGSKILSDVWILAKQYPAARRLKLSVIFNSVNQYGEPRKNNIGSFNLNNLKEVRRFRSVDYYLDATELTTVGNLLELLSTTESSPYFKYWENQ